MSPTPTGTTKVAGVIGAPISHSLSPTIHNAGFDKLGLDWVYVALPVAAGDAGSAVGAMKTLGIAALSVTMPHKAEAFAAADTATATARKLGAANCLTLMGDGRVEADNTDGRGFVEALRADSGLSPSGLSFAVIGAGGAARAVILALAESGAREVAVINRSRARAEAAAELAGAIGTVASTESVAGVDVVVNATPLGMGNDDTMPCDPVLIRSGQVAIDLIYQPAATKWLLAAEGNGAEIHNGLTMLIHQAAVAFRRWTGREAPVDHMKSAAMVALSAR